MKLQFGKLNKKYYPLLIVLMAVLLITSVIGGVFAKYLVEYDKDGEVGAAEFYFESDLLTEAGATYTLNAGTTSISFDLKNHADKLRFSEVEIDYTVAVSTDDATTALNPTSGKLTENVQSLTTVTLSNMENGKTYTVTATGTGGYEKTISATFIVRTEDTGFYKYIEDDPNAEYVLLTVWTANTTGTATITIPTGLIPDRTDPALTDVNGSFNVPFNEYESHVYRFFKTSTYVKGTDFSVVMGSKKAELSVPA